MGWDQVDTSTVEKQAGLVLVAMQTFQRLDRRDQTLRFIPHPRRGANVRFGFLQVGETKAPETKIWGTIKDKKEGRCWTRWKLAKRENLGGVLLPTPLRLQLSRDAADISNFFKNY